jgi:hypothetical protein
MLLESVKRKKINMFVLKSGYTPYTLIPLTPEGGIKKKQMAEKKWKLLISTLVKF